MKSKSFQKELSKKGKNNKGFLSRASFILSIEGYFFCVEQDVNKVQTYFPHVIGHFYIFIIWLRIFEDPSALTDVIILLSFDSEVRFPFFFFFFIAIDNNRKWCVTFPLIQRLFADDLHILSTILKTSKKARKLFQQNLNDTSTCGFVIMIFVSASLEQQPRLSLQGFIKNYNNILSLF